MIAAIEVFAIPIDVEEANRKDQFAFWPPIEIRTFLPADCHFDTSVAG